MGLRSQWLPVIISFKTLNVTSWHPATQIRRTQRSLENSEVYKDENWNENKLEHEEEKKRNRVAPRVDAD
jgi:hypothetical protein